MKPTQLFLLAAAAVGIAGASPVKESNTEHPIAPVTCAVGAMCPGCCFDGTCGWEPCCDVCEDHLLSGNGKELRKWEVRAA
ncbi:hypothetical protein B0H66DRAFT_607188 [Apodospora peruviana]|uniref:Uncharacterized protein n=1 Tax=Apodospora peruviana TaxID=516989 RepID=A0AAE0M022_9PEZI|nr:hypothetical protein B0H66DRAFT_607188 [Apodospora peruviana]